MTDGDYWWHHWQRSQRRQESWWKGSHYWVEVDVWRMCHTKLAYICGGTLITANCLCLLGGWWGRWQLGWDDWEWRKTGCIHNMRSKFEAPYFVLCVYMKRNGCQQRFSFNCMKLNLVWLSHCMTVVKTRFVELVHVKIQFKRHNCDLLQCGHQWPHTLHLAIQANVLLPHFWIANGT